jgi:flagellar biosynthesis protein FlhF
MRLNEIDDQLKSLRAMLEDLCRRKKSPTPDLPIELVSVYTRLIDGDVHEPIASGLVCRLRDEMSRAELAQPDIIRRRLMELVGGCLCVSGPIVCESGRCKVVSLVGPTGVGKTATVAKLAANFKLRQQLRVGLVTVDTFRIAAVEQLRTYAEIIDAPIKVATSPREMGEALAEFSELDLVLVDTVGRSPRDELRIKELKAFLQEAASAEVHLVLSAVASSGSLLTAIERFSAIGANRLLFCKLDEAASLGGILSSVVRTGQPVSYLGDGQDVPDNIDIADAGELAEQIVDRLLPETVNHVRRAA